MEYWILPVSFFLIALIYSSVGFGGGSSYLALLALPAFSLGADIIRPTSLLCNLFVVTGSSFVFITKRNSSFFVRSGPTSFLVFLWRGSVDFSG